MPNYTLSGTPQVIPLGVATTQVVQNLSSFPVEWAVEQAQTRYHQLAANQTIIVNQDVYFKSQYLEPGILAVSLF